MERTTKARLWPLPWWRLARRKSNALKQVRARDGDDCWRCGHPMRFGGIPNRGKAATIEHLTPLSKGGSWKLDNLVLCHVGCNRHMKDFPPEHKERMRINTARPKAQEDATDGQTARPSA